MIRKSHRAVKPRGYSMDKGFDAEKNHKVARKECRAESMIPIRERKRKRVKGRYRRLMLEEFDEEKYHRRSIAETVISVEKRVFGDVLCSRSDRFRNKEVKLKNFCYNIYRHVKIFILEILRVSTELLIVRIIK